MTIKAIVCMDMNNGIGYKNELLCKLPNDMERFKRLTTGEGDNTILCGYNTYMSMGKLPNRDIIVASKSKKIDGIHTTKDVHEFIRQWEEYSLNKDLWIIGGEEIYKECLPLVDKLYVTVVHNEFEKVDTYFPILNDDEWELLDIEKNYKDYSHNYHYDFWTLKRK